MAAPTPNTLTPEQLKFLQDNGVDPNTYLGAAGGAAEAFDPFGDTFSTGKLFAGYQTPTATARGAARVPSGTQTMTQVPQSKVIRASFANVKGAGQRSFTFRLSDVNPGMHARVVIKVEGDEAWHDMVWYNSQTNKQNLEVSQVATEVSNDSTFSNPKTVSRAQFHIDNGKVTGFGTWNQEEAPAPGGQRNRQLQGAGNPARLTSESTNAVQLLVPTNLPGTTPATRQTQVSRLPRGNEQMIMGARRTKAQQEAAAARASETTIQEELKKVYNMPPDEIKELKTKLWMSGAYGNQALEEIGDLTTMDETTYNALGQVMTNASRYHAAGVEITWQDLLDKQAQSGPMADGKDGTPVHIELTDPALLEETMRQLSPAVIGRRLSPDEVREFVNGFHAQQSAQQTAASVSGDSTTVTPSYEAQATQFVRNKYPDAAKAVEWGDRASEWQNLLMGAGGVPQPEVTEV